MSGICGVVHWDGAPVGRDLVLRMADAAARRSTDGWESEVVESIGFAHLTYRLTPESVYERQPLRSADGNLLLTADIRLDNRDELLYLVEAAGEFSQPDPTDADLLLSAYRRWGLDCPRHLLGDFAFALYDRAARRLFAARDAMAMRPFYYRIETNRTLFASEVKQLLAVPGVSAEICEPAVAAHLVGEFGHLDWTFYKGIAQLAPAFALTVDGRGVRTWRYWEVDPGRCIRYRTREDYVQHFRHLFVQAVSARLRTRHPSGIFLSGGMDSGSVASTAAWIAQRGEARDIRAYCWAFDDLPECDEREISDQLVTHFDLPVTYIPAATARPLEAYPDHGPDRDEPFIGVYQPLLEQTLEVAAAEGMGLMLSGDRGDLMVGHWIRDYFPLLRHGHLWQLGAELLAHRRWGGESLFLAASRYVLQPGWHAVKGRLARRSIRRRPDNSTLPPWVSAAFAQKVRLEKLFAAKEPPIREFARKARYDAVFTPLQMRGMVWSERTYAKYGIAFADPWSDRRIASFVLSIPQQVIAYPGGPDKRLAREAMHGIMPEPVRRTARKIIPYPLYRRSLEQDAVGVVESLLSNSVAAERGYVDDRKLREHYDTIRRGGRDHPCFWWALTLEMWLRAYWT